MITLVSGLPRSGTSMLMQVLDAGGIKPLTDYKRAADIFNKFGYYEYEPVKRIQHDKRWIPLAENKAVKIVAPLIEYFPFDKYDYALLFITRDVNAIVDSQYRMIGKSIIPKDKMINVYHRKIADLRMWLYASNVRYLMVSYEAALLNPKRFVKNIDNYLGLNLNLESMEAAIYQK